MTKRFTKVSSDGYWKIKDSQADYKEIWDLTNPQLIEDRLNQLNDENEQLKCENKNLKSILNDFIFICNRLQSNQSNKQTVAVARDMLQNMGVDLE